jgi:ABC-type lipoprotein export system ATPase subunit
MNILEVNHMWKSYKTKIEKIDVLKDMNLSIQEKEMVAIMGSSGSGKTTLLNLISGIDKADKGEIIIDGNKISDMKKSDMALFRRRRLGLIFQDFNLLESLSVKENILVPMALEHKDFEEQEAQVANISRLLGIEDILGKNVFDISGGQKQRVAISRALVNNPAIIFADEPTGNLDSKATKDVMNYFTQVNETFGTSILVVTHDTFAASYCHRIVLLKDGAIVAELKRKGTKKQFFHDILELLEVIGGAQDDI